MIISCENTTLLLVVSAALHAAAGGVRCSGIFGGVSLHLHAVEGVSPFFRNFNKNFACYQIFVL